MKNLMFIVGLAKEHDISALHKDQQTGPVVLDIRQGYG